jgi:hypothetical protein
VEVVVVAPPSTELAVAAVKVTAEVEVAGLTPEQVRPARVAVGSTRVLAAVDAVRTVR